jgi:hypothetical protein
MKMSQRQRTFHRVGLWICTALAVSAQLYTGSLTGTVLDPSGASVADANITCADADRGTRQ